MFETLATHHPILSMFLYVVIFAGIGVGLFFSYSAIRKRIDIKKNMKARALRDKSR